MYVSPISLSDLKMINVMVASVKIQDQLEWVFFRTLTLTSELIIF